MIGLLVSYNLFLGFSFAFRFISIDLSRNLTNNGAESRSGWTKIQETYENMKMPAPTSFWFYCS